MGNGLSPCLHLPVAAVRLVYWDGQTRLVTTDGGVGVVVTAGDVAAELPAPAADHAVCRADSFFVGLPVPVMSPGEELLPGRTYFVLPAARLSCGGGLKQVLTAATLAALSPPGQAKVPLLAGPGQCPFEYVKGRDGGAALIRVLPEFIEKVISRSSDGGGRRGGSAVVVASKVTTTAELKRHYAQLVGPRNRTWSPRLETIPECDRHKSKWLRSPARLLLSSR